RRVNHNHSPCSWRHHRQSAPDCVADTGMMALGSDKLAHLCRPFRMSHRPGILTGPWFVACVSGVEMSLSAGVSSYLALHLGPQSGHLLLHSSSQPFLNKR